MTSQFIVAAIVTAIFFTGCGNTEKTPAVISQASEASRDGREAFAKGQVDEAYKAYGRALKLHRSVDDSAGIVRTLVNLAVVSKAAERISDAHVFLDAVDRYMATVDASTGPKHDDKDLNEALAEASWMRAYLHARAGRIDAAWAEIKRGKSRSGAQSGKAAGRFANLEARLFFAAGDPVNSLAAARRAQRLNQRNDDDSETADSWRFIGRASMQTGDPSGAYDAFSKALTLDRKLGRPPKVVSDLLGMAEAARDAGRPDQARAWAERALTAAHAAGDAKGKAKALGIKRSL